MAGMMGDPMRVNSLYNPKQGGFPSLNTPAMPEMPAMPAEPQKPKAWGKGGRAWQILGVIGDALQKAGGGEATFMPAFLDMQEQTRKEKARLQELQAQQAALAGLNLTPQQQAAVQAGVANYSDFRPSNAQPYRWEDNAGNVWERGADGKNNLIFTDKVQKWIIQGDKAIPVDNPYLNEMVGGQSNLPEVGTTIRMDDLGPPTMQNTPAPSLGSNGFPSVLSPMQYQALVNEKGKSATDAFIARHNIQIGN